MEKYYRTTRDSQTGMKMKALLDKAAEFDAQEEVLRKKYGFGKVWISSFYYRSLDIVEFKEEPDMADWKRMKDVSNGYSPRARSKNKELLKDFENINKLQIRRDCLDEIIGNVGVFNYAGFDFTVPGVYLFILDSSWKCKVPKDCEEITNIEFERLTSDK